MADFDLSKITGREPPLVTDDERDAEIAYLSDVVANRDRELAALRARVAEAERLVAELRKTEDIQSATIRDLHGEIETLCGHLGRIRDGGARTTSGKWLDWTRSTLREVAQDALDRKPVPVFRDAGNKPEQSFSTKETDRG